MSFNLREVARWFGKPVGLYRFTRQSLHWRYTSSDEEITTGEGTYTPLAISGEALKESYERQKRRLTLTLPANAPVCQNWLPHAPSDPILVTLQSLHRGDGEVVTEWVGRVFQPKFTDTTCELLCDPSTGSMRPRGMQNRWQRDCPLALYSQGDGLCNLPPEDFAEPATLSYAMGNVLRAAAWALLPASRLAGGYLEWTSTNGLVNRRTIIFHSGNEVRLDYGAADLLTGKAVVAYHGCAHTFGDCKNKGNKDNYGGCPNLPQKNPFSGNPIW